MLVVGYEYISFSDRSVSMKLLQRLLGKSNVAPPCAAQLEVAAAM
jgi:hypothetical protein